MTDSEILKILTQLGTSELSDALDRYGLNGQCYQIMPLARNFRLCGRAYTLHYASVGIDRGNVGDFIDDLGPGQVVVIDNTGRLDATIWGDLLTSTAHRRGVGGTVIDGICRDVDRSLELNYPIYSRANWMRTGKDRVRLESTNVPVTIGGVRVEPGDYLRGDGDGVVNIPASRIDQILEAAQDIHRAEDQIREMVLAGTDLRSARAKVGYHDLQKRRS